MDIIVENTIVDQKEEQQQEQQEQPIAQGPGQALGEIDAISKRLNGTKATKPEITKLYRAIFGERSNKATVKKELRAFSGFVQDKASTLAKEAERRLGKLENETLKDMCHLLDLKKSGVKTDIVDRIVDFLKQPRPSTKRSTMSGFMMYATERRKQIKEQHPTMDFGEVSKQVGQDWRNLPETERHRYNALAFVSNDNKQKANKPTEHKNKKPNDQDEQKDKTQDGQKTVVRKRSKKHDSEDSQDQPESKKKRTSNSNSSKKNQNKSKEKTNSTARQEIDGALKEQLDKYIGQILKQEHTELTMRMVRDEIAQLSTLSKDVIEQHKQYISEQVKKQLRQ